jgi:hypothetical protein
VPKLRFWRVRLPKGSKALNLPPKETFKLSNFQGSSGEQEESHGSEKRKDPWVDQNSEGEIPRALDSERRVRGFGRSKPLRGWPNPESGTNRAGKTLVE